MSKPFDATLKGLLEQAPEDWAQLAGYAGGEVDLVDGDISTVTGASDKVLLVQGEVDWILDLNFQSGPDPGLPSRMLMYNILLERRHELDVRSVAILLAPRANIPGHAGLLERQFAGEAPYLQFRYQVIRAWELPTEPLLEGGLGTIPLAPISQITEKEIPRAIGRMKQRLDEAEEPVRKELWTATYVLMGLRYEAGLVSRALEGVLDMEESTTYQAILQKGKEEGKQEGALKHTQELLVQIGTRSLGSPSDTVKGQIEAITDLKRLDALVLQAPMAKSWEELLS